MAKTWEWKENDDFSRVLCRPDGTEFYKFDRTNNEEIIRGSEMPAHKYRTVSDLHKFAEELAIEEVIEEDAFETAKKFITVPPSEKKASISNKEMSKYISKALDEIKNAIDIDGVKPEEIEALVRGKDCAEHGREGLFFIRPDAKQIQAGLENGWEPEEVVKGYTIGENGDCTKGELSVMKIDDMQLFDSDIAAAEQAQKDGVKLIPKKELHFGRDNDMKHYRYIDTPENRELLAEYLPKEKKIENPALLFTDKKTGNWMLVRENTVPGMDFGWKVALFDSDRRFVREGVYDEKSPEDAMKSAGEYYSKAKLWFPESAQPYNVENNDPQGLGKDKLAKQADDFFDILQRDGTSGQKAEILASSFETLSSKPDVWNFLIKEEHAPIKKALYVAASDAFLGDNLRWLIENGPEEQWREIKTDKKFCEEVLTNAEKSITNDDEFTINPTLELAEKVGMTSHALNFCKKLYEGIPAEDRQKRNDFIEKINAFKKEEEKHIIKSFLEKTDAFSKTMQTDDSKRIFFAANAAQKNFTAEEQTFISNFLSKSGAKSEKELADFLKKQIEQEKQPQKGKKMKKKSADYDFER